MIRLYQLFLGLKPLYKFLLLSFLAGLVTPLLFQGFGVLFWLLLVCIKYPLLPAAIAAFVFIALVMRRPVRRQALPSTRTRKKELTK